MNEHFVICFIDFSVSSDPNSMKFGKLYNNILVPVLQQQFWKIRKILLCILKSYTISFEIKTEQSVECRHND